MSLDTFIIMLLGALGIHSIRAYLNRYDFIECAVDVVIIVVILMLLAIFLLHR